MGKTKGPFQYRTGDELRLCGSWGNGGVAVVKLAKCGAVALVPLAPTMFDVLAVLILKAKADEAAGGDDWVPRGFLAKKAIFGKLRERLGGGVPYGEINRYLHRLRNRFKEYLGAEWTASFFEFHRVFGHRLSTPPKKLHLTVSGKQ